MPSRSGDIALSTYRVGGCGESARAAPRIAVLIGDRTPGKRANGGAGARWLTPKRPSSTTVRVPKFLQARSDDMVSANRQFVKNKIAIVNIFRRCVSFNSANL